MTAPTSSPRGERPGSPGTAWESQLHRVERIVADSDWDTPLAPANRAARRAAARFQKKTRT